MNSRQRNLNSKTIKIRACLWAVILASLVTLVGVVFLSNYLNSPLNINLAERTVMVKPGSSLKQLGRELERSDTMRFSRIWVMYAQLVHKENIKAGEYELRSDATPLSLLVQLNKGNVLQYPVTFVEGSSYLQAIKNLQKQQKLKIELTELSLEAIRSALGIEEVHLEGVFYPDTYFYTAGMSDVDLLKQSYLRMKSILNEEWESRAENLPYKNAYEALIMASIIEKETGAEEERAMIAGVFVRRLNLGMRLQTDPTVIYGLRDVYQGNIKRKHLQEDTPYNTYTRSGLPPTPIALVGRAAIHAALHPEEGDSLFFVAMGDGRHKFSSNLAEHEKAVREFQLQRKKDYHSSPLPPTTKNVN